MIKGFPSNKLRKPFSVLSLLCFSLSMSMDKILDGRRNVANMSLAAIKRIEMQQF